VDGEVAGQKMLDYLIKHCVTNEMKQRAAELLGTVKGEIAEMSLLGP